MYLPVSTAPYIDILVYIYLALSRDSSRAYTPAVFISFTDTGVRLRIFPPHLLTCHFACGALLTTSSGLCNNVRFFFVSIFNLVNQNLSCYL